LLIKKNVLCSFETMVATKLMRSMVSPGYPEMN